MGPGLMAPGPRANPTELEALSHAGRIPRPGRRHRRPGHRRRDAHLGLEPGAAGAPRRVPGQPGQAGDPRQRRHRHLAGARRQLCQKPVAAVPHRFAAPTMSGTTTPVPRGQIYLTDLGLYSITFNNDLDADVRSLEAFRGSATMRPPTASIISSKSSIPTSTGVAPELLPHFINDCILRCLAGVVEAQRPRFLKIAYNGPKALEELASFDPEPGRRRARRLRRHDARYVRADPPGAKNTARASRCSAARSTWPNRRSTSCG